MAATTSKDNYDDEDEDEELTAESPLIPCQDRATSHPPPTSNIRCRSPPPPSSRNSTRPLNANHPNCQHIEIVADV